MTSWPRRKIGNRAKIVILRENTVSFKFSFDFFQPCNYAKDGYHLIFVTKQPPLLHEKVNTLTLQCKENKFGMFFSR